MFSLYFTLQIKQDIKHKQKTTRETWGNLEQSFARELLGNAGKLPAFNEAPFQLKKLAMHGHTATCKRGCT